MFVVNAIPRLTICPVDLSEVRHQPRRQGYSVVEVVIILAIVGFTGCCVLMILPGGRETARQARCQKNLMQIGVGVQLYEQLHHQYPASLLSKNEASPKSPIQLMLESLSIEDFRDVRIGAAFPKTGEKPQVGTRIPGLICTSDSSANSNLMSSAISYRANVGSNFAGTNGPFSSSIRVGSQLVEDSDGLSYTAGFAERLVGTGLDGVSDRANYLEVPIAITDLDETTQIPDSNWRGDAGSSWADGGWRSAIYSHAIPPNTATSRIARDGLSAAMSASSSHPGRIHVWMLDGSLRVVIPTINPMVWSGLGSYQTQASATNSVPADRVLKDQAAPTR